MYPKSARSLQEIAADLGRLHNKIRQLRFEIADHLGVPRPHECDAEAPASEHNLRGEVQKFSPDAAELRSLN
jgi:hypothetical protein